MTLGYSHQGAKGASNGGTLFTFFKSKYSFAFLQVDYKNSVNLM
jgi:hypothetical protein